MAKAILIRVANRNIDHTEYIRFGVESSEIVKVSEGVEASENVEILEDGTWIVTFLNARFEVCGRTSGEYYINYLDRFGY